ncbi:hypothetical protein RHGRI_036348 [Rhododendron griersonianum]|uniref:Uncharacterized protein n=1 Tax=Rhododendron griersonianum TaxID=479676 RepID=A0AAV6HQQ3_9ERIC|nr:hypothetical protein RHGRI_036348 [Rhododendron griersonianum]
MSRRRRRIVTKRRRGLDLKPKRHHRRANSNEAARGVAVDVCGSLPKLGDLKADSRGEIGGGKGWGKGRRPEMAAGGGEGRGLGFQHFKVKEL